MLLRRLKLITFDVTDTLLTFKSSVGEQYGEIGLMYGLISDNKNLNDNFKAIWRKMQTEHPNFGLYSGLGWENWWRYIVRGTFQYSNPNATDKQFDLVSNHLINVYKTSTCWQHCSGALNLLSYIRSKGIKMGVISNSDPRLNQLMENVKLKHYFQFILTSYEFGAEKPDIRIFQEAMSVSKISDLKPHECLHIGDNPLLDYEGAKSCGWQALVINNDPKPKKYMTEFSNVNKEHLFASLYDLHKYFIEFSNEELSQQTL